MNRKEALQWLVENLKDWPNSSSDLRAYYLRGWKWYTNPSVSLCAIDEVGIFKEDWLSAKQPAPLTRDQALAWLVENVKAWPKAWDGTTDLFTGGWDWFIRTEERIRFAFVSPDYTQEVSEQDWQAAQPAPASNKPSWADAPADANILSCALNNGWYWGSYKNAEILEGDCYWTGIGDGKWIEAAYPTATNPNWRDTLEYRPAAEESTPIDTRQSDSIAVGEALTEADTITPEQVAAIFADAMDEYKKNDVNYEEMQYVPLNLVRIKQLSGEIERAELSLASMKAELFGRKEEMQDILNYCKFST